MYDLNLTVPNFTSPKYSADNRFLLLKNYLYELNEVLSIALEDKQANVIQGLSQRVEDNRAQEQKEVLRLKNESLKRFEELKSQIIRTAEELTTEYTTALSRSEAEILQTARGEFTAKSEFGEYKNTAETSLGETAEKIELNAKNTEELSNALEGYKKSNNAQLTVQAEAIMSHVSNAYTSQNESAQLEERISSKITQSSQDVTESFSQSLSQVKDDLSSVGGELAELVSDLDVYIRRGLLDDNVYGIEIGRSDSNIKARFTNDRLSFFQGATEVAYISGSNLYITRAEVLDYLKIGNSVQGFFTFDITENGLEVRWTDGS